MTQYRRRRRRRRLHAPPPPPPLSGSLSIVASTSDRLRSKFRACGEDGFRRSKTGCMCIVANRNLVFEFELKHLRLIFRVFHRVVSLRPFGRPCACAAGAFTAAARLLTSSSRRSRATIGDIAPSTSRTHPGRCFLLPLPFLRAIAGIVHSPGLPCAHTFVCSGSASCNATLVLLLPSS